MLMESQRIIDDCTSCGACVKKCAFLEQFCASPVELAEQFVNGVDEDDAYIPYLCTLCGLCDAVCRKGLSPSKMCAEARVDLFENGFGPLPAHSPVVEEQKWVRTEDFVLEFPDPLTGKSDRVFMPGCHLTEYSPELVASTYEWLLREFPNTGFLFRCCAAPTKAMGNVAGYDEMGAELMAAVKAMGASEIIVACPNCCKNVGSYAGDITVRTVYELMAESDSIAPAEAAGASFALHDPCAGRWDTATHAAVRTLLGRLGVGVDEFRSSGTKTTCCGMGGMVGYVSVDMPKAVKAQKLAQTDSDIVTYCGSCRETFATDRPALHVLDLMFNGDWENAKTKSPNKMSVKHDNIVFFRKALIEKYGSQ